MNQKSLFVALLVSVFGFFAAAYAHATTDFPYRPYQALVKFKDIRSAPEIAHARVEELYAGVFLVDFDSGVTADEIASDVHTAALINDLNKRPDVEYAHPNFRMRFAQVTPNDPLYPLQWNLEAVGAPEAWSLSLGDPGIVISVLDSGYSSHPDLISKWVYVANSDNIALPFATDSWAHSTHVASIAAGATDNYLGTAGICPQCSMQSIKVSDPGGTPYMSAVINAIGIAVANDANVVNLSLSVYGYGVTCGQTPAMQAAIDAALDSGVSVVVAAGNNSNQVSHVVPASCQGVVAVAATDSNNQLAQYSNRGDGIALAAPGGGGQGNGMYGASINCPFDPNSGFSDKTWGVLSSWTTSISYGQNHCYRYLSGTSMAAPHVSGAIGLMLSVSPQLTPQQIKVILEATSKSLPGCGVNCGAGMLNLEGAILGAIDPGALFRPDVFTIRKQSASGRTEVHVMDGGADYQSFNWQMASALHPTGSDQGWSFHLGDYNSDGVSDIYAINRQSSPPSPPFTLIHVMNGADSYQSYLINLVSGLHSTGTDGAWQYALGDYNDDGVLDLYVVRKNSGSGKTEVHILDGANWFQTFLLQIQTALSSTGVDNRWEFLVADHNGDGVVDLYAIDRMGSLGTTVYVLNGADHFQTFLVSGASTILPQTGSDGSWGFSLGDYNADGVLDIYAFKKASITGRTEIYVLDGVSSYQSLLRQDVSVLGVTGVDHAWLFFTGVRL